MNQQVEAETSTSQTASLRKIGRVTNATGDAVKFRRGRRWGFCKTPDGKDWFFHEKDVTGEWPQELDYVSFLPLVQNVEGKQDRAVEVTIAHRRAK